jgi:hypothetical protein
MAGDLSKTARTIDGPLVSAMGAALGHGVEATTPSVRAESPTGVTRLFARGGLTPSVVRIPPLPSTRPPSLRCGCRFGADDPRFPSPPLTAGGLRCERQQSMRNEPVYVLIPRYHKDHAWTPGIEMPDLFASLELAKQETQLPGPWVPDPDHGNALTASGDRWDAYIYTRYVQRVPHEPRGVRRISRCGFRDTSRSAGTDEFWIR